MKMEKMRTSFIGNRGHQYDETPALAAKAERRNGDLARKTVLWTFFVIILSMHCFAASGELIVFLGDAKNPVERDFKEKYLPQIKEVAKAQGVTVIEKSITKAAPENVHFTPAMYYQNHLGRSLFLGRYQSLDKVKTFLRTVARMPQGEISNEKHDVLVWQRELVARAQEPAGVLDDRNPVSELDALEQDVLSTANALGIGPMGFGGKTTLLGVKICTANRVPASFFVSVSYMCWAFRRRGIVLDPDLKIERWLY